jgi:hypothetical protein
MDDCLLRGRAFLESILPPGFFQGGWPRTIVLIALAALVVVDSTFWQSLLFGSRLWRGMLWVLVVGGLGIGGFAFWRRDR